jgi:hypothetical protein
MQEWIDLALQGWDSGDRRVIRRAEARLRTAGPESWLPIVQRLSRSATCPTGLGTIAADLGKDVPPDEVASWWRDVRHERELDVLLSLSLEALGATPTAKEYLRAVRAGRFHARWGRIEGIIEDESPRVRAALIRKLLPVAPDIDGRGTASVVSLGGAGAVRWLRKKLRRSPPARLTRPQRYEDAAADIACALLSLPMSRATLASLLRGNVAESRVGAFAVLRAIGVDLPVWRASLLEKTRPVEWARSQAWLIRAVEASASLPAPLRRQVLRALREQAGPVRPLVLDNTDPHAMLDRALMPE